MIRPALQILFIERRGAFTLIELLVVITIIVVLLSLLTPALDRAIYSAELAVCGANHKAIVNGVTTYAMGNKRRYPHREVLWVPEALSVGDIAAFQGGPADDRPALRPYLSMDAYLCPMAGNIDLNTDDSDAVNKGFIKSSSALWYGWRYQDENEQFQPGMFKLGDRWGYKDVLDNNRMVKMNTIAHDNSITYEGGGNENYTAHPDDAGVFTQIDYNFEGTPGLPVVRFLWTGWWGPVTHDRGLIDMNVAFADGSVSRREDIDWDYRNPEYQMPQRTLKVPRGTAPEDEAEGYWRSGGEDVRALFQ